MIFSHNYGVVQCRCFWVLFSVNDHTIVFKVSEKKTKNWNLISVTHSLSRLIMDFLSSFEGSADVVFTFSSEMDAFCFQYAWLLSGNKSVSLFRFSADEVPNFWCVCIHRLEEYKVIHTTVPALINSVCRCKCFVYLKPGINCFNMRNSVKLYEVQFFLQSK